MNDRYPDPDLDHTPTDADLIAHWQTHPDENCPVCGQKLHFYDGPDENKDEVDSLIDATRVDCLCGEFAQELHHGEWRNAS